MKNCKKLMEKRKYWIGEYNLMEIKFDWEILLKLLEEAYGDIIPPSTAIKTIFFFNPVKLLTIIAKSTNKLLV